MGNTKARFSRRPAAATAATIVSPKYAVTQVVT